MSLTRERWADEILGSESMMWLMSGANHVESHLATLRPYYDLWVEAGGLPYGKRTPASLEIPACESVGPDAD